MRSRRFYAILAVFLVFVTACTLPLIPRSLPIGGLVTGITDRAHALGELLAGTQVAVTDSAESTPSVALLAVSSVSACRTGPGSSYSLVFQAQPGTKYQILGSYTPEDYWIVTNQSGEICWLPKQGSVVTGNAVDIPEYTISSAPAMPTATAILTATPTGPSPTPTATPTVTPTKIAHATATPPLAPSALHQARTCAASSATGTPMWIENVTLTWFDTQGELGYTVLENGDPIAQVAQNSTFYQLQLQYAQSAGGGSDTFGVQAYNRGGASSVMTVSVPRCP